VDRPAVANLALGEIERRAYEMALDALEQVLCTGVVGVVCQDDDGVVSIVPSPGIGRDLFEALGGINWARLIRLAEKYAL